MGNARAGVMLREETEMKKIFLGVIFVFCMATTLWSDCGPMSVQVKSSALRSSPSFLASVVASVAFGEQVRCLQQTSDGWAEVVTAGGKRGYIHTSALGGKQVEFSSGGSTSGTGASGKELALAGKGFNQNVEDQFSASHGSLDYATVDRMEQIKISSREIQDFVKAGGLRPLQGGVK